MPIAGGVAGIRPRHRPVARRVARLLFVIPLFSIADALAPLRKERQTLRDRMVVTRLVREPEYGSRRCSAMAQPTDPMAQSAPRPAAVVRPTHDS